MCWADPDQTNATDEDAADGADGKPSIGQPVRLPEVFIGGEGLVRGAADVLGTLLHEAAHALAHVRDIKDTSRQGRWHNAKFKALAEELGIEVAKDPRIGWSPTAIPASTREEYAEVIDELGRVAAAAPGGRGGGREGQEAERAAVRVRVRPQDPRLPDRARRRPDHVRRVRGRLRSQRARRRRRIGIERLFEYGGRRGGSPTASRTP
jgi:hypothetical protein